MLPNFFYGKLKEKPVAKLKARSAKHTRSAEREISFEPLAAELRKLTEGSCQTPSEILLRESRDERYGT
jgi:plasmid stability protein